MTNKKPGSCIVLAMMLLVCANAISVEAQGLEKGFDPHQPISNDGQGLSPSMHLPGETSMESFEGLSPQGLSQMRFADTGATIDGAQQELEGSFDSWSMPDLPGLGHPNLKSIVGTDNRSPVLDATAFPWRAVAHLTIQRGVGRLGWCSGWFFGPDIVVTAGSCVHSGGPGGVWTTKVRVYPGRNASSSPFGFCTSKRLYSVEGWVSRKDEQYNYGISDQV